MGPRRFERRTTRSLAALSLAKKALAERNDFCESKNLVFLSSLLMKLLGKSFKEMGSMSRAL